LIAKLLDLLVGEALAEVTEDLSASLHCEHAGPQRTAVLRT
jgi:hypothetical protein